MSNTRRATGRPTPAAKAEATEAAVEFEFEGRTYTIPPSSEWDLDVLEAYEDEKAARFVRSLLGPQQWATFRSKPRTLADLNALAEALMDAAGTGN